MAEMQTKTISFHQVTPFYPTQSEIKSGIYAMNRMSGDLVRIPRSSTFVDPCAYSLYAPASAFPASSVSKYDEKYADLVKAKDLLKDTDRYNDASENIGRAIFYIKRFLNSTLKR